MINLGTTNIDNNDMKISAFIDVWVRRSLTATSDVKKMSSSCQKSCHINII